jgi:hypothetical protein
MATAARVSLVERDGRMVILLMDTIWFELQLFSP